MSWSARETPRLIDTGSAFLKWDIFFTTVFNVSVELVNNLAS
jgi:hypothetical protein